jgi:RHS repeat-associated protein
VTRGRARRALAAGLALALAGGPAPAAAAPSDGSTLAGDRGLAAASVPGAASATADPFTGAAAFQIPIDVPPGTGRVAPQLALVYSSAAPADSWVGAGWSLGPPSIQRSLRRGMPAYDASDGFELAGEPLLRPDPQGAPNAWRTRAESFARVEYDPAADAWRVWRPDGTRLRFGLDDDARIRNAAGATFQWLLSEQEDTHGSYVAFEWDRRDPGTAYPARIRYTLRRRAPFLSGERGVEFALEPRDDQPVSHAAGFERQLRHRLGRIDIRAGGQLLRRYDLRYATSPDSFRSLLVEVAVHGSDADAPAPAPPFVTRFGYHSNVRAGTTGFAQAAWDWPDLLALVDSDEGDTGVRLSDVDGDGRPDAVRATGVFQDPEENPAAVAPDPANGVYLNTGAGFAATPSALWRIPSFQDQLPDQPPQTVPLVFAAEVDGDPHGTGVTLADLTGDGRADLASGLSHLLYRGSLELARVGTPWFANDPFAPGGFRAVEPSWFEVDGAFAFAFSGSFRSTSAEFGTLGGNVRLADLTGDGLPELVVRGSEEYQRADSGRRRCFDQSYVVYNRGGLGFESAPVANGELDPDCEPDGAFVYSPDFQPCDLAGPGCFGKVAHVFALGFRGDVGKKYYWYSQHELGGGPIDLDADGLADWALARRLKDDSGDRVEREAALNAGDRSFAPAGAWAPPEALWRVELSASTPFSRDLGGRFADVNGDGRVDLLRAQEGEPVRVWLNDGDVGGADEATGPTPWVESEAWPLPPGVFFSDTDGRDTGVRLLDLDGDGMTDVLEGGASPPRVHLGRGSPPDLLVSVESPLGGATRIGWRTSSEFEHRGGDGVPDLPQARPVVGSLTLDDGRGTAGTTAYEYADGAWDPADRAFRGFGRVVATDPAGTATETRFHQDLARVGLPMRREVRDAAGRLWRVESFEYEDDSEPPFRRLEVGRTLEDHDGDEVAAPWTRRSEREWDAHGNPVRIVERGFGAPDRITELGYVPNDAADVHITDRPAWLRRVAPGTGAVLEETRFFWDQTSSHLAPPVRGDLRRQVQVGSPSGDPGDAPDLVTDHAYDGFGNRVSTTNPRGRVTTTAWDPAYRTFPVRIVEDAGGLGRTTLVGYTAAGCGATWGASAGLPHSVTDWAGNATTTCYDVFGRPVRERRPDGGLVLTEHPGGAGPFEVRRHEAVSGLELRSSTTYLDGLGRAWRTLADGPQGQTVETRTVYDALGRPLLRSRPFFSRDGPAFTQLDYDPLGRITRVEEPGGRVARTIQERGRVRVRDPNGNGRDAFLDAFGQVAVVREFPDGPDGAGLDTAYEYDHAGRLVRVTPSATGLATRIGWDALGRRRSVDDPDAGLVRFDWDANGNLSEQTDARGAKVTWVRDGLDRVVSRTTATGGFWTSATWTWDDVASAGPNARGRPSRVVDAAGVHRFRHDALGRVVREEHDLDGRRFAFSQTWDLLGQPRERTYPSEASPRARIQWLYDADGFLVGARDVAQGLVHASGVRFDASGRLVELVAGDGVRTRETWDPEEDVLREIEIRRGSRLLERLRYGFDAGGRVTSIRDLRDPARDRTFAYDSLDRLKRAIGPFGPGFARETREFGYDLAGNLVRKDGVLRGFGAGAGPHALTSVGGVSLAYDAAGNLRTHGSRTYGWDALGRLQSVSQDGSLTWLTYDHADRRVKTAAPAETRWLPTDDFEWDGARATVHVVVAGRRVASRSFEFAPPLAAAAVAGAPHAADAPLLLALSLGPPAALLWALAALALRRERGWPARRAATAAIALAGFWLAQPVPVLAGAFADLDGDGLADLDEQRIHASDPARADTDGDGWRDGEEVAAGSSPVDPGAAPRPGLLAPAGAGAASAAGRSARFVTLEGALAAAPAVENRPGYEPARAAAARDLDGDGFAAAEDEDDDGDGVPDAWEAAAGGDPDDPEASPSDFDGDGVPDAFDADVDGDGIEDAWDADRDNDGLSDADEIAAGTGLLEPDSDGDGVRDGSERALGSDPLSADSDGDGLGDADDLAPTDPARAWTAASLPDGDLNGDGRLDAADGLLAVRLASEAALAPTAWQRAHGDVAPLGGPGDGALDVADALLILRGLAGDDLDGDGIPGPIELGAGASPFLLDSDGDGLSDSEELAPPDGGSATDPRARDGDGDGASDAEERRPGPGGAVTDPTLADSDGDGIPDGRDGAPVDRIVFHHGDHLGSVTSLTNHEGVELLRTAYRPFGEAVGAAPAGFGFTGQRFEAALGIYDYGARWYDPALGRFLSPDPLVPEPGDPRALDRYAYVLNNPLNLVDPTGQFWAELWGGFTSFFGGLGSAIGSGLGAAWGAAGWPLASALWTIGSTALVLGAAPLGLAFDLARWTWGAARGLIGGAGAQELDYFARYREWATSPEGGGAAAASTIGGVGSGQVNRSFGYGADFLEFALIDNLGNNSQSHALWLAKGGDITGDTQRAVIDIRGALSAAGDGPVRVGCSSQGCAKTSFALQYLMDRGTSLSNVTLDAFGAATRFPDDLRAKLGALNSFSQPGDVFVSLPFGEYTRSGTQQPPNASWSPIPSHSHHFNSYCTRLGWC